MDFLTKLSSLFILHNKKQKISFKTCKNDLIPYNFFKKKNSLFLKSFALDYSLVTIFYLITHIFFFYSIRLLNFSSSLLKYSLVDFYSIAVNTKKFNSNFTFFFLNNILKASSVLLVPRVSVVYSSFSLKKKINYTYFFKQVSFFTDLLFSKSRYLYFFYFYSGNTINLYKNVRLNLDKSMNFNTLSILFLFNNNVANKHFLTSNYNLSLLSQYLNSYSFGSSKIVTNNDLRVVSKKFSYFEFFLKKFLESVIRTNIYIGFMRNDIEFIMNNQYYLMFIKRVKKLQIFSRDMSLVRELVEVLILSIYTHDVSCFKSWLIKVAEKIHFKLHKRFFYIIKIIIAKYFSLYFKYFGCLGFCLRVQGKIGLGGSSKTRSFWIKSGQFSLTKKNLKICYTTGHIRTYSGILGVEIVMSYI